MKVVIDRIEDDIAIVELENGDMINIPAVLLEDAKDGDIVEIKVLKEETKERKNFLEEIADKLFEN